MHITSEQQTQINQLGQRYNLKLIVLYGSHAKSQAGPDSDIDIAVLGFEAIPSDVYIQIINDFMDIFGNQVDVKTLHHKNILFKYQVMRDCILLYGNQTDFIEFKIYAANSYIDAKDLFQLQEKIIYQRQADLMSKIESGNGNCRLPANCPT